MEAKSELRHSFKVLSELLNAGGNRELVLDEMARIEALDKIIQIHRRSRVENWYLVVGIALVSFGIFSLLSLIRVRGTYVRVELETSEIGMTLDQIWEGRNLLLAEELTLDFLTQFSAPALGFAYGSENRVFGGEIRSAEMALESLSLPAYSTLRLIGGRNKISLSARLDRVDSESRVQGSLWVEDWVQVRLNQVIENFDSVDGEVISFAHNLGMGSFRIDTTSMLDFEINRLPVSRIACDRTTVLDERSLKNATSLIRGTIFIPVLDKTIRLDDTDVLYLDCHEVESIKIENSENIRLVFRGRVRGIRAGPPGFAKDIRPTLAGVLLKSDGFRWSWSIAISILGLMFMFIYRRVLAV